MTMDSRYQQLFGVSEEDLEAWARTGNQVALEAWLDSLIERGIIVAGQASNIINELNKRRHRGYWETIERPYLEAGTEEQRRMRERPIRVGEFAGMPAEQISLMQQQRVAEAERVRREREWYEAQEEMPGVEATTAARMEALRGEISPAAQRYFERELASIYREAGMPEARQKWWEEKTRYIPEPPGVGGEDWWKMSPEEMEAIEEPHREWEEMMAGKETMEDPWDKFLKEFKFKRDWQALTPRERGERTSQFRPRTRFLTRY